MALTLAIGSKIGLAPVLLLDRSPFSKPLGQDIRTVGNRNLPMFTVIHEFTSAQVEQLHQMYLQEWWSNERALADMPRLLANSDLLFGLWDEEAQRLAGFCRVLTDWVYRAIVFDVIVAADYRGQGLGAELIEQVTHHPKLSQVECIQLFCMADMQPFYEKYGFGQAEQLLMVRPRG